MPTLFIASDHAGLELKARLKQEIGGVTWADLGPQSADSVDYPDYADKLAAQVGSTPGSLGILICGSGIGMSIAANRHPAIRAALVENPSGARLARQHNHANVLCLGARFLAPPYAVEIVRAWLEATPDEDPRHARRVAKLGARP